MAAKKNGYSLIELICVIALLGLVAAAAVPALQHAGSNKNLEIAARNLATDLRKSHQLAITAGSSYCVEFLMESQTYQYRIKNCSTSVTDRYSFPEGITYSSTTFKAAGGFPRIRFYPNGSPSSGGTVVIGNGRGDRYYVIVTPATGRVRISPTAPEHW